MAEKTDGKQKYRVSRRNALQTVGVGSLLGVGMGVTPTEVMGGRSNKKKITIFANGDVSKETVRVSKRWISHTKKVDKVRNKLRNQLLSRSDVHSVGVRSGERTIGNLRSEAIDIQVTPSGTTEGIPSSVEGIPVVAGKSPQAEPTGSCGEYYDDYADPVQGGHSINSPNECGTLTCRVKRNGVRYMLACRHIFLDDGDPCNNSSLGTPSWGRAGNTLGTVVDNGEFKNQDAVLLQLSDVTDESFGNSVVSESGVVEGRVTKDGLKYLNSKDLTVEKRGQKTGIETGYIKKIQQDEFCSSLLGSINGVVRSTPDQKEGDSGGPVYYEEVKSSKKDELYIVNIATLKPGDGSYDARGSSANKLNSAHGVTFGGNPYTGN